MVNFNEDTYTIDELNGMFDWYCNNFAVKIQEAFNDFYGDKFALKLVSLSKNINVLFQGENYFVTKIRIDKNYDLFFRCSATGLKIILDDVLGENPNFDISALSDLEGKMVSSFNDFTYNKVIDLLIKPEKGVKRKNFDNINLTFFVKGKSKECGKFILSIPKDLVVPNVIEAEPYDISKFNGSILDTKITLGTTIFTLKELKSLELEDIVVLDNSNSSTMHIIYEDYENDFEVFRREELVLPQDYFGGEDMGEKELPQNLWDSIQVEMGAELESVKVTLGELKAIAKGQVMDLHSIYDTKVSLIVEGQTVAKGDLVIINDRFGVKVDEIFEVLSKGEYVPPALQQPAEEVPMAEGEMGEQPEGEMQGEMQGEMPQDAQQPQEGSEEEFDYSDFNLDEQDI